MILFMQTVSPMHIKRIWKSLRQRGWSGLARWQALGRRRVRRPVEVQLEFPQWLKR